MEEAKEKVNKEGFYENPGPLSHSISSEYMSEISYLDDFISPTYFGTLKVQTWLVDLFTVCHSLV